MLAFKDRETFREWLEMNGTENSGVWLVFGKKGGPVTLSAHEALEEALCFGWIDGQMQRLDDTSYKKYFARRIAKSKWSEKNKKLTAALIEKGRMRQQGLDAIAQAKKAGTWDSPERIPLTDVQIEAFKQLIQPHEPAYTNLLSMPLSVHRTYAAFYLDAKTDKTHETRLARIVDRLNNNLKPM